jgi:hypothetical protein
MSDTRDEEEPVTGNDPTNGLAGDLEGDDGGVEPPPEHRGVLQEVIADFDPDRVTEEGAGGVDGEDSATPYSEEGRP